MLLTQVLIYIYGKETESKMALGGAIISDNVIAWVKHGYKPLRSFGKVITMRNTDVMAHVMKGAVGIRLDFVTNCQLLNNQIVNIRNVGIAGLINDELQGYIDGGDDSVESSYTHRGHPKSDDTEIGYTGNQSRALSLVKALDVGIQKLDVQNIVSATGSVFGVDLLHTNTNCQLKEIHLQKLSAGLPQLHSKAIPFRPCFQLPNWIPRCIGIFFRYLNKNCSVQEYSGESIVSPAFAATFVSSASVTDFSAHVTQQGPLNRVSYEITDDGTVAVKSQT